MQRMIPAAALTCIALMLSPASAMAGEVYRCKNENGSLTFSDQPCGDDSEIVKIKDYGDSRNSAPDSAGNPVVGAFRSEDEEASPSAPVASRERYYDPVVRTYAASGNIVNETDYYIEFRDVESAKQGKDLARLKSEHDVKYLYYQSAYPTCRSEIDEYFARSEASDREIGKKGQEQECTAGQALEMGFKWHCYVNAEHSEEKGCEVLSCSTHFVCR